MNSESVKENIMSEQEIEELRKLIRERMNYADKDKKEFDFHERKLKYQKERLSEYIRGIIDKEPTCGFDKSVKKCIEELKEQKLKNIRKKLNDDEGFKEKILNKLPALNNNITVLKNELNELNNPEPQNYFQKIKSNLTPESKKNKIQEEIDKNKKEIGKKIDSLNTIIQQIETLRPIYEGISIEEIQFVTAGGKRKSRVNKRKSRRNKRKTSRR